MPFIENKKIEAIEYFIGRREEGATNRLILTTKKFIKLWDPNSDKPAPSITDFKNMYRLYSRKNVSPELKKRWDDLMALNRTWPASKVTKTKTKKKSKSKGQMVNLSKKIGDFEKASMAFEQQTAVTILVNSGRMSKEEGYAHLTNILNDVLV